MYHTTIVLLDGSPFSERALPYGAAIARAAGGRLILLRGTSTVGVSKGAPPQAAALAEVDTVAERLRTDGIAAEPRVRHLYYGNGSPAAPGTYEKEVADLAMETAQAKQADLVVMSTHGRGGLGRLLHGSVADQLLRQAEVPVLLIPTGCEQPWPDDRPLRMLLTLDGSSLARAILGPTATLAELMEADLLLLRVAEPPDYGVGDEAYLERIARDLRAMGRVVEAHTVVGPAIATIEAFAAEQGADLIAMATHGRSGLVRLMLGSVATGVLQRAKVPLLLVRPDAASVVGMEPAFMAAGTG